MQAQGPAPGMQGRDPPRRGPKVAGVLQQREQGVARRVEQEVGEAPPVGSPQRVQLPRQGKHPVVVVTAQQPRLLDVAAQGRGATRHQRRGRLVEAQRQPMGRRIGTEVLPEDRLQRDRRRGHIGYVRYGLKDNRSESLKTSSQRSGFVQRPSSGDPATSARLREQRDTCPQSMGAHLLPGRLERMVKRLFSRTKEPPP